MASNGSLSTKKRRAIAALLEARTVEEAAQAAKVGERTLYRWLDEPQFSQALHQAEGLLIGAAVSGLVADMSANHATMRAIRDNARNAPGVRLRAANYLDTSLLRWRELAILERRITALEAAINGQS